MPNITFRGGLLPNDPAKPRLKISAGLLDAAVPAPKATIDYYSVISDWEMYLNDQLGDCTIAQQAHGIKTWSKVGAGTEVSVTDAQCLVAYEAVSGYKPGDPSTDNGAVLQDVMNYMRKTGLGGHTIQAFAEVSTKNITQIHQAVEVFNSVTIGFSFPSFAMDQFNAGQPWDVSKTNTSIEGGHAVDVVGYDAAAKMLYVITWGAVQKMTEAFWNKYVDEAWVQVAPEWLNSAGQTVEGLNLYGLGEDFASLTGEPNPFPAPAPSPQPTPVPVPEPTPTPAPVPTPTPTPVPVDDPDAALAKVLRTWLKKDPWFYRNVQVAATAWLKNKNL